jgi:hypothetical protein
MTTRIGAYQSNSYLELTPLPDISTSSFDVVASVEGRAVHNNSLAVLDQAEFLSDLQRLHSTWTGHAILTGTYDFRLQVSGIRASELLIGIYITDISLVSEPPLRHILDGRFRLVDAAAERLFQQFNDLFAAPKDA